MTTEPRRVCLLTGAGGRLGSVFCATQADAYDIVAVYRQHHPPVPSQLQSYVDPLDPDTPPSSGRPVFAVQADLAVPGQAERVVELALARFGHVDLLVNGAATAEFGSTLANSHLLDTALAQFQLNTVLPAQLAAVLARGDWRNTPDENRRRNRSVVNMSSISGVEAYAGQGIYGASKAALNALTQHMARDYQQIGVRVNALAPTGFPHIIPTERVVARIRQLDCGDASGAVIVMDAAGERML
jgi:NAD(P)-dependent dehydrogenase (short-subunit alcohol dehydrogenase family)